MCASSKVQFVIKQTACNIYFFALKVKNYSAAKVGEKVSRTVNGTQLLQRKQAGETGARLCL